MVGRTRSSRSSWIFCTNSQRLGETLLIWSWPLSRRRKSFHSRPPMIAISASNTFKLPGSLILARKPRLRALRFNIRVYVAYSALLQVNSGGPSRGYVQRRPSQQPRCPVCCSLIASIKPRGQNSLFNCSRFLGKVVSTSLKRFALIPWDGVGPTPIVLIPWVIAQIPPPPQAPASSRNHGPAMPGAHRPGCRTSFRVASRSLMGVASRGGLGRGAHGARRAPPGDGATRSPSRGAEPGGARRPAIPAPRARGASRGQAPRRAPWPSHALRPARRARPARAGMGRMPPGPPWSLEARRGGA